MNRHHLRLDPGRIDAVDTNPIVAEPVGERVGKLLDARFLWAVAGHILAGADGSRAGHVDHVRAFMT